MQENSGLTASVAAACLLLSCIAHGAFIIQDRADEARSFAFNATFAQSFTAEDSRITAIGFGLADENVFLGGLQFTVTLFAGQGTGGSMVGSAARSFPTLPLLNDWVPDFFDFDFSAVTLNVGQVYTARISSTSGRGEAYFTGPLGDLYPGGVAYDRTTALAGQDMAFEIIAAPEPTITALLGLGLALVLVNNKTRGTGKGRSQGRESAN